MVFPFILFPLVSALSLYSESPCYSSCPSDVSSFCTNSEYNTPSGLSTKSCLICLQNSTYTSSGSTDQYWFLYRLRYTLSTCILGFNTSGTSNVCATSTACGALENQWLYDGLNTSDVNTPYDYCKQSVLQADASTKCSSCLHSDTSASYLLNFVTALQAACDQQPSPGTPLTLSATIFSNTTITISSTTSTATKPLLPLPTIIAIVIVGILLLAGLSTFLYLRYHRTRQNTLSNPKRRSSLSFRCATRVTSIAPSFPITITTEKVPDIPTTYSPYSPTYTSPLDSWSPSNDGPSPYNILPPIPVPLFPPFLPRHPPAATLRAALPALETSIASVPASYTPTASSHLSSTTPSSTHSTIPLLRTVYSPLTYHSTHGQFTTLGALEEGQVSETQQEQQQVHGHSPLLSPPVGFGRSWPLAEEAFVQEGRQVRKSGSLERLWRQQEQEGPRMMETVIVKTIFDPPPVKAIQKKRRK